ncbi:wd40 repeat protein [Plasmopara halstedii]|uniref:Wd40 repeat protein n=1 Tax=Plasmopara halstedii TaxID=4781 RepID=A0A0P1AS98_PLAHL|nr:wd40 repeat protein [Plasmopara halstedii]CEG44769.1 wd40 repeat protein [Plasmopara halstedii]|eukprot:XP_024581138.1 wd40 repeat protein [Plasmopara halstedii]
MHYARDNNECKDEGVSLNDSKSYRKDFTSIKSEPQRPFEQQSKFSASLVLEHTIGFSAVPNSIYYHPSGQDYVYPAGGVILLTPFQDAHNQIFLRGHHDNVSCIALSPSGRILASGERGKRADVLVWDYFSRRLAFRLSEHDAGVAALAFSDDERLLCSVGVPEEGPRMYIWDVQTGYICAAHQKMSNIVSAVAFGGMARDVKRRNTPNYQFATVGHRLLQLWVLDPVRGDLTQYRIEQSLVRDYTCVQFSPDREVLIAGSSSGDFCVVNVKTRQLIKVVPACSCGVNSLVYFEGGLLVGGGNGSFLHYRHDFVDTCHLAFDSAVVGIALHAAQNEVVVGTQAGSIFVVRLAFGNSHHSLQKKLLSENHSNAVVQVAYTSNVSDRFATISQDCTIRIWDASDYTVATCCFVRGAGAPTSLHYSLDVLLSGWTDGCIRSHCSKSGTFIWSIDNAHVGGVTALKLSHNQRLIVSAGVMGEVRVWDIRKRDLISHLKEHTMPVTSLALYQDDLHVISGGRDRRLLCWDLRNERKVSCHLQRIGGINAVALFTDQNLVLSAGQGKRISYWDLRIDNPFTVIPEAHKEEITCIAMAHDLEVFATGGKDRLVKLWNRNTSQLITDGVGHSGNVLHLAFSPDDRQLVSAGDDGCVFVWNLYT